MQRISHQKVLVESVVEGRVLHRMKCRRLADVGRITQRVSERTLRLAVVVVQDLLHLRDKQRHRRVFRTIGRQC